MILYLLFCLSLYYGYTTFHNNEGAPLMLVTGNTCWGLHLDQELFSVMCACWHETPWSFMYLGDCVQSIHRFTHSKVSCRWTCWSAYDTRHCTLFQIGGQIQHVSVSLWPGLQSDSVLARKVTLGKFIHLLTTMCFCFPSCWEGW